LLLQAAAAAGVVKTLTKLVAAEAAEGLLTLLLT
jgi:hypothetical protein